jgi:hypothetical protein
MAALTAALAACLWETGARAADVDAATPQKTRPTAVPSMARIADGGGRSTLKCWQEGRLIFETEGAAVPENANAKAALGAMPLIKSNGRTVQLLNLRQGLCILERSGD